MRLVYHITEMERSVTVHMEREKGKRGKTDTKICGKKWKKIGGGGDYMGRKSKYIPTTLWGRREKGNERKKREELKGKIKFRDGEKQIRKTLGKIRGGKQIDRGKTNKGGEGGEEIEDIDTAPWCHIPFVVWEYLRKLHHFGKLQNCNIANPEDLHYFF